MTLGDDSTTRIVALRCVDLPGWDTADCCSSCHEDEDYDPFAYMLSEWRDYELCCTAKQWATQW